MSKVTEAVLSDLEGKLSSLSEREAKLRAELAAIASDQTETRGLIVTIKAGKGTVKGFSPEVPKVDTDTKPVKAYAGMTIRAALRAYFTRTNNKAGSYRELAEAIGRNHGSVACVLSIYPEFIRVGRPGKPWHAGNWQAHPTWLSNGWVTVGR